MGGWDTKKGRSGFRVEAIVRLLQGRRTPQKGQASSLSVITRVTWAWMLRPTDLLSGCDRHVGAEKGLVDEF
jgi:hypothetical protein